MDREARKRKQKELMEKAQENNMAKKHAAMFKEALMAEYNTFCETNKDDKEQEAKFFEIFADDEQELLAFFDRNRSLYGPLYGITRMKRWTRAVLLGLDPPQAIKDIMDRDEKEANKIFRTD